MASRAGLLVVGLALATFLVLGSAQTASAAVTRTWTGLGATNNWSEAANWDTGVPLAGDSIVFPPVALRKTNNNDLAANTSFTRIDLTGAGYDIDGNSLQLTQVLDHDPGSGTNVFDLDLVNDGGVQVRSGKLVLGGNNSFPDEADVDAGVLLITSDTALGSTGQETEVDETATLQLVGGLDIGAEVVEITGHGFDGNGALQSLSGTTRVDDVEIANATTIGVGNSTLVVGTLHQATASSLALVGGGKLQVENSTFAGPVEVTEGNLTWNASSQVFVEVKRDGLFRGLGTAASLNVAGGTVWPGSGSAPGILTVGGTTTFVSGTFQVDLDGPTAGVGYGQLATGGLTLAPLVTQLAVDLDFVPIVGQVFRIVNNGGGAVQGTFRELPEGALFHVGGYALQVSYKGGDGNDVTLTVLRQVSANLKIEATAQPSPVGAGELLVYSIVITNEGPDTSSGVRPTMGTPVGTTYQSASGPAGWTCAKPNPSVSVSCTGPSLASGNSATFTFVFRVNANASGSISGTASVSASTSDNNSGNNAKEVITQIGPGGGKPFKRFIVGLAADSAAGASGG